MEERFLCKHCRHVFDQAITGGASLDEQLHCAKCGSVDVIEAPAWAPLGSGMNVFDNDTWEYECQECQQTFKMPIPRSPSESKSRTCPACRSSHLHVLNNMESLPLYCG